MKHPGLSLLGLAEAVFDERLLGRSEELFDFALCKFLPESGLGFRVEISFPSPTAYPSLQLHMPVIQWVEHLAEDIEELIITGVPCDFGSVGVILLFPVDIPQFEKWIPVVKGLPQFSEILFRVANDLSSSRLLGLFRCRCRKGG